MSNGKGAGASSKWNWQRAQKTSHNVTLGAKEADTVSWMIHNLQKHSLLSHEESVELFKVFVGGSEVRQVGDQKRRVAITSESKRAMDKLVQSNLKLVVAIAKGYRRSGLDFEDLLQEGNLGLIRAVEKFEWQKGYRFSTYATWWIRQAVSQFVMKRSRTVRLPAHAIGVSRRMEQVKAEYKKVFGVDPSVEELSDLMDVSESIVKATVHGAKRTLSLSSPLDRDSEDGDTLGDTIVDQTITANPFEALAEKEAFENLCRSFDKLTPKEEQILRLRFGISDDPESDEFQMSEEEQAQVALESGV